MTHKRRSVWTARLLAVFLLLTLLPTVALAEDEGPAEPMYTSAGSTDVDSISTEQISIEEIYYTDTEIGEETVYRVEATVFQAYDPESGTLTLGSYSHRVGLGEHGRLTLQVEPQGEDADLKAAQSGDRVVVQGTLERRIEVEGDDSNVKAAKLTATAAGAVTPGLLRGVEDGGVYEWTGNGYLAIPQEITRLTIQGNGTRNRATGWIEATAPGVALTIEDLHLNTPVVTGGIFCPSGSLTVRGNCTVGGGAWTGIHRISELTVEEGASLSFDSCSTGIQMEYWDSSENRMHIDGRLQIADADTGIHFGDSTVVDGSGALVCSVSHRGMVFQALELGGDLSVVVTYTLPPGETDSYNANGALVCIRPSASGLTVGEKVTGLIVGGVRTVASSGSGGTLSYDPMDGGLIVVPEHPEAGDASTLLDLSSVTSGETYLYKDDGGDLLGAAQWIPAGGGAPARFHLVSALQQGSGLYLTAGVTFPENTAVEVVMSANTAIEPESGPAITAPGCALSLRTPYQGEDWRPSLRSKTGVAISVGSGSIDFTGGDFLIYTQGGAADQNITVTNAVGVVELAGSEGGSSALQGGKSITADPQGVSRGLLHAELQTGGSGSWSHTSGSPSDSAITYSGDAASVRAIIAEGTITPTPTPPPPTPSGGDDDDDDGPASYHVVYRPGYPNGPNPVRKSYERGETVTVLENSFAAPEDGLSFSGWAEKENGSVQYRPGDTFQMPARMVTLYAVWEAEQAPAPEGPALNKTDHAAYLEGYPDGNVGPADYITREQTAVIFYRLLDAESRARYHSAVSPFPDVPDGRWSAEAVATMAKAGIVLGRPDGTFAPEAPITRAEFAAIAARFDSDTYTGPDLFADIAGHWAASLINRAAQKGWVKGGADGRFRPDDPITRAEAAALINRVLERAPETAADLLPGMRTFPDNLDEGAWYYLDLQEAANGHDYTRKADGVHETWSELRGD